MKIMKFIPGIGSIVNLFPGSTIGSISYLDRLSSPPVPLTAQEAAEANAKAIGNDWLVVGNALRRVVDHGGTDDSTKKNVGS
ncbi:MAG: hypothetical protein HQM06_15465 [Magnetococcales bacterium]|nr:hypothetical protein [Magnetococcales bacterium]